MFSQRPADSALPQVQCPRVGRPPMLRVFVSSTWLDLQPERDAVEKALARLRETKFIGMEHFGSRSENTRDVSLLEVDPADLYVGVIGGRYGSGITEAEYRRALDLKLPCFIYFKEESRIGPAEREADPERAALLDRLKTEMRRHCATTFTSPDDLAARLTADLHRWLFDRYVQGITALTTDYAGRIQNFLAEYLGKLREPVPFGGRDDDLARLDAWLEGPDACPYLLLAAPAGRGKSALLVRWTQRLLGRQDLGIALVPVSIRFRTNLAGVVFPAVTARLAALHGDPLTASPDTPVEVWRGMMTDYLRRPLPGGRRLLLVLDGLDEAADWEAGPDLFPADPPPGVRVVVSARYRAGDNDAGPWLRALGWDHPSLAGALELHPLSAAGVGDVLTRMGFPLDRLGRRVDVVAELYRLSEGDPLLVHLYVKDLWTRGEEATRLEPEDLRSIRPGLAGYFEQWWKDQRRLWGGEAPLREPAVQAVINLLACSLGPLRREDLLHLAPPDLHLSTWMLEEALQPLARFVIGDGQEHGYAFSHPRLGFYFYDRLVPAERRAAEARFVAWGEETLRHLADGSLPPAEAPAYVVQYHGTHLERTGAPAEARLALVSDGWRQAWHALEGSYAGFLNDVQRAWQAAEALNVQAARSGRPVPLLAAEVRCALCRASVVTLARQLPPPLLHALVRHRVWTAAQGLSYARQAPGPVQRVAALVGLVPHLREPQRGQALEEALAAARTISDLFSRASALAGLAPHLPGSDREDAVREVLTVIPAIGFSGDRARLLAALAPCLPEDRLGEALARVREIPLAGEQAAALAALAPHLPPALHAGAREAARHIGYAPDRLRALLDLAARREGAPRAGLLVEALDEARAMNFSSDKAEALARVAALMSPVERQPVLREALAALRGGLPVAERADALRALAPLLPPGLLSEAFDLARQLDPFSRPAALVPLTAQLPEAARQPVLEEILPLAVQSSGLSPARDRPNPELFIALAEQMAEPARSRWLTGGLLVVAQQYPSGWLADLAGRLGEAHREPVIAAALGREPREEASEWAVTLARLSDHATGPRREQMLRAALTAVQRIGDGRTCLLTRAALDAHRPGTPAGQGAERLLALAAESKDGRERCWNLTLFGVHLPGESRRLVVSQAIAAASTEKDGRFYLQRLGALFPEARTSLAVRGALAEYWRLPKPLSWWDDPLGRETLRARRDQGQAVPIPVGPSDTHWDQMAAIARCKDDLPGEMLYPLWRSSLEAISVHARRTDVLMLVASVSPILLALGGQETASQLAGAIADVSSWWP